MAVEKFPQQKTEISQEQLENKHKGWFEKSKDLIKQASIASGVSLAAIMAVQGLAKVAGIEVPPSLQGVIGGVSAYATLDVFSRLRGRKKGDKGTAERESEKEIEFETGAVSPKELPEAEFKEIEEPEKFDISKALETPGYLEFLQRHGAQAESLSKEEAEKYYKAYETTGVYADFYKETIQKETGLELDAAEIRPALENYFVSQKEMPKENEKMAELLKEYQEAPKRIADKELALGKLLGNKDPEQVKKEREAWQQNAEELVAQRKAIEKDSEISESMRGWRRFFNYRSYSAIRFIFLIRGSRPMEAVFGKSETAREIEKANQLKRVKPEIWMEEAYKITPKIENARMEAEKADRRDTALKILEESKSELKEKMEVFRGLVLGNMFEPAQKILGLTSARLKERLADIANPKKRSLKELEKGIELIEKLENSDITYLEKADLAKFSKNLNQLIERKVSMGIRDKLAKIPIGETGPLGFIKELEKSLQKLGSKDLAVSRDFVRKKLEAYIKMAVPPKGETKESFKAKKLAAKCLLLKWQ